MAFDFNEVETESVDSQISRKIGDDLSGQTYLNEGVIKKDNLIIFDGLKRIMNIDEGCVWEKFISNSDLTYCGVNRSQYMIMLLWDDINGKYAVRRNDITPICRPILFFKPDISESIGASTCEPLNDKTLYKFIGLGGIQKDNNGMARFVVLYDVCHLPI